MSGRHRTAGFTYFEMLVVVTVLSSMAILAAPVLRGRVDSSRATVTLTTMQEIRKAINEHYFDDQFQTVPFPLDPARQGHPQLAYLFVNPDTFAATSAAGTVDWSHDPLTKRGWSGPYLSPGGTYAVVVSAGFSDLYGEEGDPAPLDGWGQPIVLQQPEILGSIEAARNRRFARLVSAGADGKIDTPRDAPFPSESEMGDDLILQLVTNP